MVGVKNIIGLCFILTVLVSIATAHSYAPARISKQWYDKHGCPCSGEFILDCKSCKCDKTGSKVSQECLNKTCPIPVVKPEEKEKFCKNHQKEDFFEDCKYCLCSPTGDGTSECNSSACDYYPNPSIKNNQQQNFQCKVKL